MRKLSICDHCCGHSLKIDCSRHAFDILFDDMPESFAQIGMRLSMGTGNDSDMERTSTRLCDGSDVS
jgi:hypothetical protein